MRFAQHFYSEEFGNDIPAEALPSFMSLCTEILEPVRFRFGKPITINSGYRAPEHNKAVGGAPTSQHIATSEYCAADFVMRADLQVVFDWIRLISGLPFDQVILERDTPESEPVCIHVSWRKEEPRRIALEGMSHGRGSYRRRDVGAYYASAPSVPMEHFGDS